MANSWHKQLVEVIGQGFRMDRLKIGYSCGRQRGVSKQRKEHQEFTVERFDWALTDLRLG